MMSEQESPYSRFFWVVVAAAIGAIGLGVIQFISMREQLATLNQTVADLKASITTLQQQTSAHTATSALLAEQVRVNQQQAEQITELRLWQARVSGGKIGP